MSRLVYILNGPNLNLLGRRDRDVYGRDTLADIEAACHKAGESHGLGIRFHQSNAEHELLDWIHEAIETAAAIVINPAAYTHTSVAIYDALAACNFPVIEVHLSNIHAREDFRHTSYVSKLGAGLIAGLGLQGYVLALAHVAHTLDGK